MGAAQEEALPLPPQEGAHSGGRRAAGRLGGRAACLEWGLGTPPGGRVGGNCEELVDAGCRRGLALLKRMVLFSVTPSAEHHSAKCTSYVASVIIMFAPSCSPGGL